MMKSDIEIKDDIYKHIKGSLFGKSRERKNFARHQKDHPTLTGRI